MNWLAMFLALLLLEGGRSIWRARRRGMRRSLVSLGWMLKKLAVAACVITCLAAGLFFCIWLGGKLLAGIFLVFSVLVWRSIQEDKYRRLRAEREKQRAEEVRGWVL